MMISEAGKSSNVHTLLKTFKIWMYFLMALSLVAIPSLTYWQEFTFSSHSSDNTLMSLNILMSFNVKFNVIDGELDFMDECGDAYMVGVHRGYRIVHIVLYIPKFVLVGSGLYPCGSEGAAAFIGISENANSVQVPLLLCQLSQWEYKLEFFFLFFLFFSTLIY